MENTKEKKITDPKTRLTICVNCPHFEPTLKRCKLCKCFMYLKIFIKSSKCPDEPRRW